VDGGARRRYLRGVMSASHSDASDDHGPTETHPHPPMPAVTDEASDTPAWVPVSGLVLFVVMVLFVMMRAAMTPTPDASSTTTDQAYGAEAAPTPAAAQ